MSPSMIGQDAATSETRESENTLIRFLQLEPSRLTRVAQKNQPYSIPTGPSTISAVTIVFSHLLTNLTPAAPLRRASAIPSLLRHGSHSPASCPGQIQSLPSFCQDHRQLPRSVTAQSEIALRDSSLVRSSDTVRRV